MDSDSWKLKFITIIITMMMMTTALMIMLMSVVLVLSMLTQKDVHDHSRSLGVRYIIKCLCGIES